MAGLLDFLAGSSDPSTADPTTGLVDAQRKQLAYGILGQTGAALLAAGAPQYPGQQGQYLAQLGQIPGNLATQQSQMVQQNLMSQRGQLEKTKVAQDKQAQEYIQSPEYQQQLSALPDVLKAQAMVNIKAGNYSAATAIVGDYVKMQIASRTAQLAADREANKAVVTHDAAGNPIAYYPGSGKVVPIGGAQDPYAAYGLAPPSSQSGGGQANGGAQATMPTYGQGTGQPLPDGTPTTDTQGSPQANAYPNASINPNFPYERAFGIPGGTAYAAGRIQGGLGLGKIKPELNLQNAAVSEYDKFRTELVNEARSEDGSGRLKSIYNAINETLPVAGSIFHDAPYALKQLSSAKNSIEGHLRDAQSLFQAPATKPVEKQKLAGEIMSLRKNRDNLNIIVDKLSQSQGGTKPQGNSGGRLRFNPETGKIE